MKKNLSIGSPSMPPPRPSVIPLPVGDPGGASPVEILDLRIRNRTHELQRLLQILNESSFAKRGGIDPPIHGSFDRVKELEKIYQYASALLLCNEIPKLASTRRYHNFFDIGQQLDGDHKAIGYAWNSWWTLILKERRSPAAWGTCFQDYSHPIASLPHDDIGSVSIGKQLRARPLLFTPIYSNKQYTSKAANFVRSSMQERKYILNFFQDIGKIKKKIMICRFDIYMNRSNHDLFITTPWHLRLREIIRQLMERVKNEFKSTIGYLHFIPSSNTIADPETPSFSHLIMIFDLAKGDHHLLSQAIASSRVTQGDNNAIECRPTCAEQGGYKAIGCGLLDLSRVSSLPVIHEIADYMTVERRVLRPLVPKPGSADRHVIKGLQLHSFL